MFPAVCRVIKTGNLQHGERKNLNNQARTAQRTFAEQNAKVMPVDLRSLKQDPKWPDHTLLSYLSVGYAPLRNSLYFVYNSTTRDDQMQMEFLNPKNDAKCHMGNFKDEKI